LANGLFKIRIKGNHGLVSINIGVEKGDFVRIDIDFGSVGRIFSCKYQDRMSRQFVEVKPSEIDVASAIDEDGDTTKESIIWNGI
jgi:hypothetical protein